MDVQGSQYHLLDGRPDWSRCVDSAHDLTMGELWADAADGPPTVPTGWEYDDADRVLRLRRDTPLFRRSGRSALLDPESRRGAGRDAYDNWFWISEDERCICWLPGTERAASTWWSADDLAKGCTCDTRTGAFASVCTCPPPDLTLRGLTVTTRHFLLAGYTSGSPNVEAGLLVFDLQAGGAPLRMLWPDRFEPWDLADAPAGGALVLDREHSSYWRLDDHLRLPATQPSHPIGFVPVDGSDPILISGPVDPTPFVLLDEAGDPVDAISIEPGPAGSVLVMDAVAARGFSILYCYDGAALRWQSSLEDIVEVVDPDDPTATGFRFSLLAHDFCYATHGGPLEPPVLYVADAEGNQVVAFTLDPDTGVMLPKDDFLPMRRWAERALVRTPVGVHYDFGERWISLQVFGDCRFATSATLTTPVGFGEIEGLEKDSLDSGIAGCVWHRLLLDAHVPTGTSVRIRARASDDPELLLLESWLSMPVPYQRADGSELPWTEPWADRVGDPRDPTPLPDGMGTHELLFQHVIGRYLQIEVTLTGGGRASPLLRSLRAWYPRFSYAEHYLPAVFVEHDGPDRFLERFLANFEGTYTALEERIEHSHLILDPRTARAADLPWLACWFGLTLDPLWDEARRRFLIRHVDRFYRMRGTVAGLVATLRVYLEPVADEGVFRSAASGSGGIRVVEKFLTRDTGGAAYGAPEGVAELDPETRVRNAAHRFDVLVPVGLDDDDTQMVERIIENAKPAYTAFALRRYYELFVIGQARLGIDTEIGHAPTFQPMIPGGPPPLAMGYLGYPRPFDIADRVVSDRDRVGAAPAL